MGFRFFADHCVSNAIMQILRDAGQAVLRLRDQLPIESPDPVVISKAQQLDALLLSLNGDFADIVSYPPANYQGIIALQVRNHPEIIHNSWQGCAITYHCIQTGSIIGASYWESKCIEFGCGSNDWGP